MLELDPNYMLNRITALEDLLNELPEVDEVRNHPPRRSRAQELIQKILEHLMEVVEHVHSRYDQSSSPAYRERVRGLAELGLFERSWVERHLVPLAGLYEGRAGLRIPLDDEELDEVLTEHRQAIADAIEAFRSLLSDPESYGLRLQENAGQH